MDRRDFLKQVAAFTAASAAIPLLDITPALAQAAPAAPPSTLVVGKGKDYPALTRSVLEKLGGMNAFVKKGDKVVIKPNIGWARPVELAANTHPEVVTALVRLALDAGAGKVMVFDVSCDDARMCYTKSGIRDAVEAIKDDRVSCPYVDQRMFMPVKIASGKAVQQWDHIVRDAIDADCYINVPVAKTHGLTKLTLGFKNIMGICGGNRGAIHQRIADKLVDLHMLVKQKLVVIDATRILTAHGPNGGTLENVKTLDTIIASTDPVAADAYATTLFGMKPTDLQTTVVAHQRGLGEIDLAKVNVIEVA